MEHRECSHQGSDTCCMMVEVCWWRKHLEAVSRSTPAIKNPAMSLNIASTIEKWMTNQKSSKRTPKAYCTDDAKT